MSRAPRDIDELLELAGDDPKDFADTLEADGRAEADPTKVEEARMVRQAAKRAKATANTSSKSADSGTGHDAPAAKPASSKPDGKTRSSRGKKAGSSKRAPATRRAISQATPDRQVARVVRSSSSYFWTIAGGIVLLVIVYQLTRNGDRAAGAVRLIGVGINRIVYPRGAFPVTGDALDPDTDIQDPNLPYQGGPIVPTPDKLRQ